MRRWWRSGQYTCIYAGSTGAVASAYTGPHSPAAAGAYTGPNSPAAAGAIAGPSAFTESVSTATACHTAF